MSRRLLCFCLLAASVAILELPAYADRDAVQFGSSIHVARDNSIHDAVCFFCSVDADGTVEGDVVVFFGNVHIGGHANHDVVNFFGSVTADSDSSIGQNLVSFFGNIRLGENVSVGKDMVAMFGAVHAAPTVSVGGDRVVQPGWLFWGPLLIFGIVIVVVVREIREQRRRAYLRRYPFPPQP
jgi:hypothetical protein